MGKNLTNLLLQDAWAAPSIETTPIRSGDIPDIGAVLLESPRVPHGISDFGNGSSAGSSVDGEAGVVSPGKLGPTDFELLRVVGQGAFGKVSIAHSTHMLNKS